MCGVAAFALLSCGEKASDAPDTEISEVQNTASTDTASAAGGSPELGDWGVEVANIDDSVDPGDDFYRYASGKWLDTFEIPEEFSSYGSFTVLFERSEEQVRKIIEDAAAGRNPAGSVEQKIGDFFASYTDVDAINEKGLAPIADDLSYIDSLENHEDVARAMARADLALNSFFGAWVDIDSKQTDRYIVYLTQSGLGMPNRDYYLEDKFANEREKYKDYIAEILTLAETPDAEAKAAGIYAVEEAMAQVHWEPAKRRNRDLTYNLKTKEELIEFAPGVPWAAMLDEAGVPAQNEFVVREDDALQSLAQIFADTPVAVWRDYMRFHLLSSNAAVLPTEFDDANFAFFGTELRGTPKKRERWKRGVAAVNGALGEAVGKVYVDRHFPADSKTKMDALVANLRRALDERLDTLAWMSDVTKVAAHEKLEKFTPKIGYPEKWEDYSDFDVVRGDAYGNAKSANAFGWEDQISKLGQPIDRTEWFMNPQRVNAYYSPNRNEIVFPAAILQAPFFDPNADPAVNYGGIGAVIGHEIGHGFDDQGRKSDGDGMLRDWWTGEDAAAFQELADALGAQYASYEPIEGFPLDPNLTMGENIGDVGGLAMAYHAYKLSLNGEKAPVIDGYTGDQRFLLAWAQVWKRQVREEALKNQIARGPHSPARYRVNGVVRNMDVWYDAFNISEDDELYLAPEDRVQIW
ncbi:MAG: M13 family metallopeptidase [Marinicaulis sp.]|nr:M13 family metallopeptidase [Marinicaulis sp.]